MLNWHAIQTEESSRRFDCNAMAQVGHIDQMEAATRTPLFAKSTYQTNDVSIVYDDIYRLPNDFRLFQAFTNLRKRQPLKLLA